MVANPTLVQSNAVATSVNSPASITAALLSASTVGNTLLMSVAATGSSPAITTPAGWTLVRSTGNASIVTALFALPNNAGGITTVVVTLSGTTNGGAVASMFEFSAMPTTLQTEFSSAFNTLSNQFPNITNLPIIPDVLEVSFYTVGFTTAASLTGVNTPSDFSGNVAGATSTVATTNVTLVNRFVINNYPSTPTDTFVAGFNPGVGSNLSAAVPFAAIVARFLSAFSVPIHQGASSQILIGAGGNPAGSLQAPQPQAPGNFFSGSIGVG